MIKKQFGQFFTKNADYILQNFDRFVREKNVTDPFAGDGDLINWAKKHKAKKVVGYDVDKKFVNRKTVCFNDSLKNPKKYQFVITNPPYLNVNKADLKTKTNYFKSSIFEDLYQISLASLMESEEGIVIVPINFLSAENSSKIRDMFFSKFLIDEMNYFREPVFADTTYNVIAFHYKKKKDYFGDNSFLVKTRIYPEERTVLIPLSKNFHWTIGGEITARIKNQENFLGVRRLTEQDIKEAKGNVSVKAAYNHIDQKINIGVSRELYKLIRTNIMLLKAIDSGSEDGKIALDNITKYGVSCLISKETSRHMIYLLLENKRLSISEQEEIISLFNREINKLREDYYSLFLTNYRDNDRKRISFDFVYKFINYLYSQKTQTQNQNQLFYSLTKI